MIIVFTIFLHPTNYEKRGHKKKNSKIEPLHLHSVFPIVRSDCHSYHRGYSYTTNVSQARPVFENTVKAPFPKIV
jgi:hypothetical protein